MAYANQRNAARLANYMTNRHIYQTNCPSSLPLVFNRIFTFLARGETLDEANPEIYPNGKATGYMAARQCINMQYFGV